VACAASWRAVAASDTRRAASTCASQDAGLSVVGCGLITAKFCPRTGSRGAHGEPQAREIHTLRSRADGFERQHAVACRAACHSPR
jgi:hypothetical protein